MRINGTGYTCRRIQTFKYFGELSLSDFLGRSSKFIGRNASSPSCAEPTTPHSWHWQCLLLPTEILNQ
jgi:hypothetical protein